MLTPELFSFLKDIKKNNNRDWFNANKDRYETVREEFKKFIADLLQKLSTADKSLTELTPNSCIFRFNRDTRFASDKTPYKKNFSAFFSKGGRKSEYAGYYIHLEPGNCFFGAGTWMPPSEVLAAVRQEIDYNQAEFLAILKQKDFKKHYKQLSEEDKLRMVPKGYDKEHPLIEYLKLKSFIAEITIKDEEVFKPDFIKKLVTYEKAIKPLIDFLNKAIE